MEAGIVIQRYLTRRGYLIKDKNRKRNKEIKYIWLNTNEIRQLKSLTPISLHNIKNKTPLTNR